MNQVYIGLGSNLDNPLAQLKSAIQQLSQHASIQHLEVSALYGSKPVGPQDQPDYTNAVARFQTHLDGLQTLDLYNR